GFFATHQSYDVDFSDVKGQGHVKRAMEVAVAGGHNVLMIGPPGSGKSMLSKRIPTIIPPLSLEEAIETTKIHSIAGLLNGERSFVSIRPFRSPHHTISDIGLLGGGAFPNPGEVSLAHNGVLFLDELREFKTNCNARMTTRHLKQHCKLSQDSQDLIRVAMNELNLSARAYDRILKVSRTIADLDDKIDISPEHVSEAIQYRTFDRTLWV